MSGTTVTTELDVELAKFLQKYAKADERVTQSANHTIRESQRANRGVDQGVGAYGAKGFPLPASVTKIFGGVGANGSGGLFGDISGQASAAGAQSGEGLSAGMAAGIGGAAGGVIAAFAAVIGKVLSLAEEASMDLAKLVYHGLEYNYDMTNAQAGIASIVATFQKLDDESSKDVAVGVLESLKELAPVTAGGLKNLTEGFLATIASAQHAGLTINENITLASKFANTLGHIGMPAWQLPQEMKAILDGTITKDSVVAKRLGITNELVAQWNAAGTVFDELSNKLGKMGEAGDLASVVLSRLRQTIDSNIGKMTKGLFDDLLKSANGLEKWLRSDTVQQKLANMSDEFLQLWTAVKKMAPDLALFGVELMEFAATALRVERALAPLVHAMVQLGKVGLYIPNKMVGRNGDAAPLKDKEDVTEVAKLIMDKRVAGEHALTEAQQKSAEEHKRALEAIASLHERINKLRISGLAPDEQMKELAKERAAIMEKFSAGGGRFYAQSPEGMEQNAAALAADGRLDAAKAVLELQEKYVQLLKEESGISKRLRDDAAREAEGNAEKAKKLDSDVKKAREKTAEDEFGLLSPKQQMQQLRQTLSESFGLPIKTAADVQKGLAADRAAVTKDQKDGNKAKELADQEKLQRDLENVKRLEGLAGREQSRAGAPGETVQALNILSGGSDTLIVKSNDKVVDALTKLTKAINDSNGDGNTGHHRPSASGFGFNISH